ncbi:MAG: SNF2 helicase associated domain-containing protein [Bacillota bacterium]
MIKLKLDENIIKKLASSIYVFRNGQSYFMQKRVSDLDWDSNHNMLRATVEGGDDYFVEIEFNQDGRVEEHYCDCPAHASFEGACKHVVATLFAAHKKYGGSAATAKDTTFSQLITQYEYMSSEAVRDTVRLEVTVNLERYYNKLLPSVELKIGSFKTYVVKSLEDFIEKLSAGSSIEFGKGFTFSPQKHSFTDVDYRLIELLRELYELEGLQKTLSVYSYTSQPSAFKGKKAYLTHTTFKRVLEILENKSFTLLSGNRELATRILREDLPLEFKLKKQGSGITLALDVHDYPEAITQDFQYCLYNDYIYKLSDAQRRFIVPMLRNLDRSKPEISFKGEESSRFVTAVLPYLKKGSTVNIDDEVEKNILEEELIPKIYLDKSESGITAVIDFCYGQHTINPFITRGTVLEGEKILIRDNEKERTILAYFEKDDFKVRNGTVHLEEEERIYDFLLLTLPKLQDISEIYYSDEFKKIKIRDSRAFSGGVRLNTGTNMLEFSFHHDDIDKEELISILAGINIRKKYYRLKDGSFIPIDDGYMLLLKELLDGLDIDEKQLDNETIVLPQYRAMYLDNQLKQLKLYHIERSQYFKQLVQNVSEPQDMEYEIPEELKGIMREYQKTGFKWLSTLSDYKMGGILADDMGLGKTLQTIAFILANRNTSAPSLVVAPTSLLYNWQEEVKKFAPSLKTAIIAGPAYQRHEQIKLILDSDIVITSYPLIRRDIELYEDIEFSYCFIDEAQHIKNPDSVNARSVKQIKAGGYFALTGTPIENSLSELWSIFDFILPGYLLTHSKFVEKYEKPIIRENNREVLERLSSQISPFIMRRLKRDVLKELPDKIETRMIAELSEEQKRIYLAYLQQAKSEVAIELKEHGFDKSHIKILSILTRLRQICCHPSMFIDSYDGGSGKLELLEEIIEEALEGNHRILIFSQFTSMLKIIREWLKTRNIEHLYLDGSTPVQQRSEMVKAFNNGTGSVFLISLKAGGTGLNLTGADMVIHFDPWWNPAVEDQATDRAHRIGQKNVVQVVKLITKGTIEEKVYELQQKKKDMIQALIQPGETFISKLSEDEVRSLFDI